MLSDASAKMKKKGNAGSIKGFGGAELTLYHRGKCRRTR